MNRASSESDGVPFGGQLHHRACVDPDGLGLVTVALDGSESFLTWHQLDHRANQWGRAIADAGVRMGGLVALALPNCEDLVLGILGCWKIGAVPIPMRWDIPDWERSRLLDVIDAALVVEEHNRSALAAAAAHSPDDAPAGSVVAERLRDMQQRVDRPAQGDPMHGARRVDSRA